VPYLVGGFGFRYHGSSYSSAVQRGAAWIRKRFPFDLIHAHTGYLDGGAALALSKRFRTLYLITEHTSPFSSLMEDPRVRRQTLEALGRATCVWGVSSSLEQELRSYLPEDNRAHVHTLHNGVDTRLFHPPVTWSPNPAAPRLLAVMALEERKAPLLLLEAFLRLRRVAPGATLDLVGEGPEEKQVRRFVREADLQNCVMLWGNCSRPEVARLMRERCDLFVLSSHHETFGVVLIEALASGKPVVATRCGGPADIVTDPMLGALCPPGNLEALTETLVRTTAAFASFDGRAIRRWAVERFDFARLAATLAAEYRKHLTAAARVA
jgi:glycosyltransferase involved in cell wall biosynthesis